MEILQKYLLGLTPVFQQHYVKSIFVFGSVLTHDFNSESDVDMVVNFLPIPIENYADNYFELHEKLEKFLKREVDLLEGQAIRNPYVKKEIDRTKRLIYDYGNQELVI